MKRKIIFGLVLVVVLLGVSLATCPLKSSTHKGWFVLRWVERPVTDGPSQDADPAKQINFEMALSYDQPEEETATTKKQFADLKAQLREGDVVAYRSSHLQAVKDVIKGKLNKIGYSALVYGHLAIVVKDPTGKGDLRVFSSQSFKGPNTKESLETLKAHDWDIYRLDKWDQVDASRLSEFVRLSREIAGKWYGYDFSGMFGLWNSNLSPNNETEIGHDYVCSTVVLAALHYSGVDLDAVHRKGIADGVTPLQVVTSQGRLIAVPDVVFVVETSDDPETDK